MGKSSFVLHDIREIQLFCLLILFRMLYIVIVAAVNWQLSYNSHHLCNADQSKVFMLIISVSDDYLITVVVLKNSFCGVCKSIQIATIVFVVPVVWTRTVLAAIYLVCRNEFMLLCYYVFRLLIINFTKAFTVELVSINFQLYNLC